MSNAGRPPLPATVHQLRGDPSKLGQAALDARNLQVPAAIPPKPDFLLPEAAQEWDRIAPLLLALNLLTELDLAALSGYCEAYATWAGAQRILRSGRRAFIDRTPNKMRIMSVTYQIARSAEQSMRQYLADFGLTPAARVRLRGAPAQGTLFPDSDPMEQFLKAGNRAN